ncbi:MAG: hypothetical protein Q8T11_14740 [Elusimicrobiota bacterium]|nr:hypothetical protein [Elusimicrobiota bacterium]
MAKNFLAACLLAASTASAGVIAVPTSPVRISVPTVTSGLPANHLSLNPLSLTPLSLTPSTLPPALIPSPAAAVAAATPSSPHLNVFWDGITPALPLFDAPSAAVPLAGVSVSPLPQTRLAPWLVTSDPKTAAALDRAVVLARATRAGRRALDEASRVLAEQGRSLPVRVLALGRNYGEYDYVSKDMRLHKDLFLKGREVDLAGTLVHELTHVAQHALGVPSNALEMEIEAHLQDLAMLKELGRAPPPNTFARQLFDALAQGPKPFIALIQNAVPGTVFLGDSSFDDIDEQLEQDLEEHSRRAKRSKLSAGLVGAIERDLDLLRTPEGRASYKAFSRRVLALLKRRAAAAR